MALLNIDPAKHPHPRRYRRAVGFLIAGVVIGILLTIFGVVVAASGYTGGRALLVTATIVGPSVIFLAAVAFATYLEGLEKENYGGIYEDRIPPARPTDGFSNH